MTEIAALTDPWFEASFVYEVQVDSMRTGLR